jgi:thiol:disulfide interchange protein
MRADFRPTPFFAAALGVLLLAACAKAPPPTPAAAVEPPAPAHAVEPWQTDYAAAVSQAKAENKKILLNFTGSDWCVNCFHLDDDVFSHPEFADYARSHFVMVQLDFPLHKELPDELTKQNEALQEKYRVENLPTLVLLDASERELAWIQGYRGEGVTGLIAELEHPQPLPAPPAASPSNPPTPAADAANSH